MEKVQECIYTVFWTLSSYSTWNLMCLVTVPLFGSVLNIYVHRTLEVSKEQVLWCMCTKALYDYVQYFMQNSATFLVAKNMDRELWNRIRLAKVTCGASIPGVNQVQFHDLVTESNKTREFLFVLPLLWSSFVSFAVTITTMNTKSDYPVRTMFTCFCLVMLGLLTYFTDASLYMNTKPSPTIITEFGNANQVKMKLSMGCTMDIDHEKNKRDKQMAQQNIQKCIICAVNLIITYISLVSGDIGQLHAFGGISWMIGCLSDNLKSLQYYHYMNSFLKLCECFERHALEAAKISVIPASQLDIDRVCFVNTSFGYYSGDLMANPGRHYKIFDLTYTFWKGKLYYLESPNGVGKSTLLRMFQSNIFSGDIYFGDVNRRQLSFDDIMSNVFHIVQASEYTPQFTTEEIAFYQGRDVWLEEQLCLTDLFKNTVELSGGQKKRMFIYIVLTSNARILLLDEILSELSTEDVPEVPEGGGWLCRVIKTIIGWQGRQNKIMVLVGHGLLDLIDDVSNDVIKLKLVTTPTRTQLVERT